MTSHRAADLQLIINVHVNVNIQYVIQNKYDNLVAFVYTGIIARSRAGGT